MKFEYLLTLLALLVITLLVKTIFKIKVFNNSKEAFIFYAIVFIIGTIWDNFAVWRGHWFYPGKGILGIFIGLIPIEDYVFAIVTSYTVLVFYKALPQLVTKIK